MYISVSDPIFPTKMEIVELYVQPSLSTVNALCLFNIVSLRCLCENSTFLHLGRSITNRLHIFLKFYKK